MFFLEPFYVLFCWPSVLSPWVYNLLLMRSHELSIGCLSCFISAISSVWLHCPSGMAFQLLCPFSSRNLSFFHLSVSIFADVSGSAYFRWGCLSFDFIWISHLLFAVIGVPYILVFLFLCHSTCKMHFNLQFTDIGILTQFKKHFVTFSKRQVDIPWNMF